MEIFALVFDTETTGLPLNWYAKLSDTKNWPRVIQLAWQIVDINTGKVHKEACELIKPDGWEVPSAKMFKLQGYSDAESIEKANFWVKHGFTQEKSMAEGKPLEEVLKNFILDHDNLAEYLVAHNMGYDHPVLGCEMIRTKLRCKKVLPKVCTMRKTELICRIPGKQRGSFKWPKLEEAYKHYFNGEIINAHNALGDVISCAKILVEGLRRKDFTI